MVGRCLANSGWDTGAAVTTGGYWKGVEKCWSLGPPNNVHVASRP